MWWSSPTYFSGTRQHVPFHEDLLKQAIRRSFALGRLAGIVALDRPGHPGLYVLLAGEWLRLVAVDVVRRPGEPGDHHEFHGR